ncbi:MAG: o-succinylbenzoate synthase [Chloroflexi bacterium]|nr:o-succinylbenzoate synthase [Chloroflexota bacterium]
MSGKHSDSAAPKPPTASPIVGVRWRPFRLPLHAPIATAGGTIEQREGVLVELRDADDRRSFGEASPLPEDGDGGAPDVLRLLDEWAPRLLAGEGPPAGSHAPAAAALRCALDDARLDLDGRRRGLRIASIIGGGAVREVRVNAVIGNGPPEWVREQAAAAVAAGYGTLKLKVAAGSLDEDRRRVQAAREAAPDARLRLDANGGWDAATAREAIDALARYDLEYVEQPVPARDLEGLARLRAEGTCLIAADESVADAAEAERVLDSSAVDVLVLKPMRLGGIRRALNLARDASWEGVSCVVTTNFDSSLGVAAALHLAAAVDSFNAWGGFAHGLSTAEHLAADLVARPLVPHRGVLHVPSAVGLGVEPDEAALEAAATGDWVEVSR